ncbi:MAG: hypothetical protein V9G19_17530 [Tetrasphaera sp.]
MFEVASSAFQIRYRLNGATLAGEQVGVDVPLGMTFHRRQHGRARADAGEIIGTMAPLEALTADVDGTVHQSRLAAARSRAGPVRAPVSGRLESSAGSVLITSPGIDVVVALRPLQELRYRGVPFTGRASVETILGQRSVPCVALWLARRQSSQEASADSGPGSTSVHCRLPASTETAPGIPAVLDLSSPQQRDVLAVPAIYVGLDESGSNYVATVRVGSSASERPVVVGATDGVRRVILSGLRPGELILPAPTS